MWIRNWMEFAKATIETKDLDPTYDFLYAVKKEMGHEWATRFTLNYLCFYDLGGALAAANQTTEENFWEYTLDNYTKFPRGTERRHSRGEVGLRYIKHLAVKGSPLQLWGKMHADNYTDLVRAFQRDFQRCGFGPYFVWKVMDFQDRIFGRPISLSIEEAIKYCPDDPRKCAAILWPSMRFGEVLELVTQFIQQFTAPGEPNRNCSYAEAETLLCMLKGWGITKTHVIGDDVESKYEQLREWPDFARFLPPLVNRKMYERSPTLDCATLSNHRPQLAS